MTGKYIETQTPNHTLDEFLTLKFIYLEEMEAISNLPCATLKTCFLTT